jgi:hypothetical protein
MTTTTKPDVLVDTYGGKAPDAAKFGVGTRGEQGAQQAVDAQRNQRPSDHEK